MRITQDRTGWWENEDNTGQNRTGWWENEDKLWLQDLAKHKWEGGGGGRRLR